MEKKNLYNFRFLNALFAGFGEARFVYNGPIGGAVTADSGSEDNDGNEEDGGASEKAEDVEEVVAAGEGARKRVRVGVEGTQQRGKFKEKEKLPAAMPVAGATAAEVQVQPGGYGADSDSKAVPDAVSAANPGGPVEDSPPRAAVTPGGPIYDGFDAPQPPAQAAGESANIPGKCPETLSIAVADFLTKPEYELARQKEKFEGLSVNNARKNYKYNPATWDHTTLTGLDRMYEECDRMGIIKQDKPYYDTAFAILRGAAVYEVIVPNGISQRGNKHLGENKGEYVAMFKDPSHGKNRETIEGLDPHGTFQGGPAFIKAYDTVMVFLREEILARQIDGQLDTLKAQQKQGVDPIGTTVVDFAKSNFDTVSKAVRDRDYATLAVYAGGGYLLWETFGKKLFGDGDGHGDAAHKKDGFDFKKWLMWGGALYGANIMLKNAGYDVGKMIGFKNMDAEVKGTPLEAMRNVLSMPKYNEEYKDLDYGIAMQMADTKLDTLQTLLKKTNTPGIHFIDPHMFPEQFENLKDVAPFKMGLGEKSGYVGNDKLSGHQREYIRVGQQLYKLAMAMGVIYDETLKKNHETFKNIPYEMALTDSRWANSKVHDLMQEARRYVSVQDDEIYSSKKADEIEAKLLEVTNNVFKNNVFVMDDKELEGGMGRRHYGGMLKGFPIVVAVDKKDYRIYLRNNYGPGLGYNAAPPLPDATIPLTGDGTKQATDMVEKVNKRMEALAKHLMDGNKGISVPEFSGSSWQSKTNFKGAEDLGVAANNEVPTEITVNADGTGLTINDGETGSGNYLERTVLGRLLGQKNKKFEALKVFGNVGRMRIQDDVPDDGVFKLLIGKSNIAVDIKYIAEIPPRAAVPAKFDFLRPADEVELLKDPAFKDEYLEAISADPEFGFNKTIGSFKHLIKDACPEKFLKHFFKSLAGQTGSGDLFNTIFDSASGTIPDSFSNMMMDTVRNQTMFKLKNRMKELTSLKALNAEMMNIIGVANSDLKRLYDDVSAKNRDLKMRNEEWERTNFMLGVTDRIRSSGLESTQYKMGREDMEALAYKMNLKGLGAGSDLNDESHLAAGKIIDIFTYYTAHLDSKEILDNLKYPPTPTPNVADNEDDALRGHFRLRYFAYVKTRISNEIDKISDGGSLHPGNVPLPNDPRLNIMDYDTWIRSDERSYDAIDPEDNKEGFVHDIAKHGGEYPDHTDLDIEFQRRLIEAKQNIEAHFTTDANIIELRKYLENAVDLNREEQKMGLFEIYDHPVSNKPTSKIWEDTNDIAQVSGGRRSVQIKLMNQKVDQFYNFILHAKDPKSGKLRFFVEGQSFMEKLAKFYYRVKFNLNF